MLVRIMQIDPRVGHPPLGDAGEALAEIAERIENTADRSYPNFENSIDEGARAEVAEEQQRAQEREAADRVWAQRPAERAQVHPEQQPE